MKWSFRVATISGIQVRVHATFVVLVALYAWMYFLEDGIEGARDGVVFTLALFSCVLLHEFGHAYAARIFGIRTPDITLLPIGGLARLERMPSSPWQELVIAVAGPAVNIGIIGVLLAWLGRIPTLAEMATEAHVGGNLIMALLFVNGFLVAFNMIPAFPMDGGRVLRALLAMGMRHSLATLVAARVGQALAVLFILAGLLAGGGMILMLIGAFVFFGAHQELAYAKMRESVRKYCVADVMESDFASLSEDLRLEDVSDLLVGSNQDEFPVVTEDRQVRGLIKRGPLAEAVRNRSNGATVAGLARPVAVLSPAMSLQSALEAMQKHQELLLPVVDETGQLVGLLDIDHLNALNGGGPPANRR